MAIISEVYIDRYNKIELHAQEMSTDVASNTSSVYVQLRLNVVGSVASSGISVGTFIGADVRGASLGYRSWGAGNYVLCDAYYTVAHNQDGSGSVAIGGYFNSNIGNWNLSGTLALSKINRIAITNRVEGNDVEGAFKVYYTKYVDSYTYKLRISIPSVVMLQTTDYNTSGSEISLNSGAMSALLEKMKSSEINLGFAVETWSGNTRLSYGNEVIVKCYLNDAEPILGPVGDYQFEDVATILDGSSITTLTGGSLNNIKAIDGYTDLKLTIPVSAKSTAQKGATMVAYRMTDTKNNSIEIPYSDSEDVTGTLEGESGNSVKIVSIDSRGNHSDIVNVFGNPSISNYEKPSFEKTSCTLERNDGNVGEDVTLTISGEFWNRNFGVKNNALNITYRFKKTDSDVWITGRTTINPTINEDSFTYSDEIASDNSNGKWDLDSSYDVEIIASDYLEAVTLSFVLNSAIPTLSLDKNGVGVLCSYDDNIGGGLQVKGERIYNKNEVDTLFGRLQYTHNTIVKSVGGTSTRLFTINELRTIFNAPSAVYTNFYAVVNNGDGNANGVHIEGCTWVNSGAELYVVWPNNLGSSQLRINYVVFYIP